MRSLVWSFTSFAWLACRPEAEPPAVHSPPRSSAKPTPPQAGPCASANWAECTRDALERLSGTSTDAAVDDLRRACAANYALACAHLAHRLIDLPGGEIDRVAARRLATQACDGTAPLGCHVLARLDQLEGRNATDRFARACEAGEAAACFELAIQGQEGRAARARSLATDRCQQGSQRHCKLVDAMRQRPKIFDLSR